MGEAEISLVLHFHQALREHGTLLTCFVHERKHKLVKKYANDIKRTSVFEHSVLKQVTCQHLANLSAHDSFDFKPGLKATKPASVRIGSFIQKELGYSDWHFSRFYQFKVHGTCRESISSLCKSGDVALIKDVLGTHADPFQCGKIHFFCKCEDVDADVAYVEMFDLLEINFEKNYASWRTGVLGANQWVMADEILEVTTHRLSDNTCLTLIPMSFRFGR